MNEKKYVIKDYSDHYYKLDQESNQLIVAKNKLQATLFTAAQIKARIGSSIKSHFYMTEVVNVATDDNKKISHLINGKDNKVDERVSMSIMDMDITNINWEEFFGMCISLVEQADEESEKLQKETAKKDREMLDLLHYVEMYNLSDDDMHEAITAIKESRIRRRVVKDRLHHLETFLNLLGSKSAIERLHEAAQWSKDREYRPRELKEFFKQIDAPKTDIDDYLNNQSENKIIDLEDYHMNSVKSVTAFDDKDINWLEFAEEQLCFYENVDQYYINLQIDIQEIDDRISDILSQIEDGAYNCAQGYNVFKELRDLRIQRKMKEHNLQCIKLLSDFIDTQAMAENIRYAVDRMDELDLSDYGTNNDAAEMGQEVVAS